jgi:hypothetical protein
MNLIEGELWVKPDYPGMIIVTTNSTLRRDGSLVMGRGAALEATQRIPGIALECGECIRFSGNEYGFLKVRYPMLGRIGFGIFQTKHFWGDPAELSIIQHAVNELGPYVQSHADWQFRMNFPGIGNGRLKFLDVLPLLQSLPDNVTTVYRK